MKRQILDSFKAVDEEFLKEAAMRWVTWKFVWVWQVDNNWSLVQPARPAWACRNAIKCSQVIAVKCSIFSRD